MGVNDGVVYFSNFADQRIYRHKIGEQPDPVTADPDIPAGDRFADGRFTPDGRFLVCVRERHVEGREAMNEVVAIQVDSGEQTVLASGHDFYSFPRPFTRRNTARIYGLGPPQHAVGRS